MTSLPDYSTDALGARPAGAPCGPPIGIGPRCGRLWRVTREAHYTAPRCHISLHEKAIKSRCTKRPNGRWVSRGLQEEYSKKPTARP
jgi:hypothetical protein